VVLIINKRSTLVRKREVSPHKNIAATLLDSDVRQRLEPHPFDSNSLLDI